MIENIIIRQKKIYDQTPDDISLSRPAIEIPSPINDPGSIYHARHLRSPQTPRRVGQRNDAYTYV